MCSHLFASLKNARSQVGGSCTSTPKQLHQMGLNCIHKSSSIHTHTRSNFEAHIARILTVKIDHNSQARIERYAFFKFSKHKLNAQENTCTRGDGYSLRPLKSVLPTLLESQTFLYLTVFI